MFEMIVDHLRWLNESPHGPDKLLLGILAVFHVVICPALTINALTLYASKRESDAKVAIGWARWGVLFFFCIFTIYGMYIIPTTIYAIKHRKCLARFFRDIFSGAPEEINPEIPTAIVHKDTDGKA